jgi:predicted dehydrogenase
MDRRTFLGATAVPLSGAVFGGLVGVQRTTKYRACVIGDTKHGGYGHNLHLVWGLHPDVEVVALADPDDAGRAKRAAEAGAERTYADYRVMLEKEQPDLISIGPRWTVNHLQYIRDCTQIGAHGLMEKPLSVDLVEADAIIEAVEAKDLRWAIGFNFRASPVIAHTRRLLIDEGLIGDILEIRSRGKEDRRAGGEDLIVLGVHLFDMMVAFLGPPLWCSSSIMVDGRPARPEDVREATEPLGPVVGTRLQATFGFQGGINGYFSSMQNKDGNGGRWGMEIYGSKGVVTIRMTTVPQVFWWPEGSWAPKKAGDGWKTLPGMPEVTPGQSKAWQYQPIVEDLIAAIEEKRRPRVSLHDGRLGTEMIQAVNESHVQGGSQVRIPLQKRDHPLKRWA